MTPRYCPDCVERPELGAPSNARWIGPDGGIYCSLHFIQRFGHAERLVRIDDYEPPERARELLSTEEEAGGSVTVTE